jgi:SpoVK/Ycf46/Vps4 family AAA+-type ATPase
VESGMSMTDETPVAAIFFGPPGTSKTELTQSIASFLQWPRLTVDPSHFVRHGLDKVQAEADKLFKMFAVAERIVILLDEFDEMVRERNTATEVLSRFLTTSMLPRLATITKHRRCVFIVATNHIEQFDLAISRPGRFDFIVPILCPTTDAKLKHWPQVAKRLSELRVDLSGEVAAHLAALTYLEFKALAPRLEVVDNGGDAVKLINHAFKNGTLSSPVDPKTPNETWLDATQKQTRKTRIP